MLDQVNYIESTEEEIRQINFIKTSIENLRESGDFFSVSLPTLELIRRFNHYYIKVFVNMDTNPSLLHQLVVAAEGLKEKLFSKN